ncbi:hypothetical protein [Sphingosinicella sp.]
MARSRSRLSAPFTFAEYQAFMLLRIEFGLLLFIGAASAMMALDALLPG